MRTLRMFCGSLPLLLCPAMACNGRGAAAPHKDSLSEAYVLRVDSVRVFPNRPGTTESSPWDNAPADGDNGECALLAAVTGALFATPVAGPAVNYLCRSSSSGQALDPEQNASLPDLAVEIVAGDMAPYRSAVVANTIYHRFSEEFLVPLAAIPDDGLQLSVVDDDGGGRSEAIGMVRITAAQLAQASASSTHLVVLHDQAGGLDQLELVVSSYQTQRPSTISMAANEGTHVVTEDLLAGEFITLSAAGDYTIGGYFNDTIDPRGYPSDGPQRYNFPYEPFQSAPHGSGLALVGRRARLGVLVAPCAQVVAPFGGPLVVGVNDVEPENNHGQVRFEIQRRASTADEWRRHALIKTCPQ